VFDALEAATVVPVVEIDDAADAAAWRGPSSMRGCRSSS